ncbi:MAG TPA: BrnT family toxin [Pyrinomonadaceae bacterium]|nr:BrnT family toxin [Pyrinomonadaceae bacterium]
MRFEWDEKKAATNLAKHGVSFEEAATVFGDPLSDTFDDPDHSADEQRFLIVGSSDRGRMLIVAHTDDGQPSVSLARGSQLLRKESPMKRVEAEPEDEMRPEYDFSQLKGRVRGKYVERYREGTNLVLLDPDVAAAFPDAKAVNDALRLLMDVAQRQSSQQH